MRKQSDFWQGIKDTVGGVTDTLGNAVNDAGEKLKAGLGEIKSDPSGLLGDSEESRLLTKILAGAVPLAAYGGISQASGGKRPGETDAQYRHRITRGALLGGLTGGTALPLADYAWRTLSNTMPVSGAALSEVAEREGGKLDQTQLETALDTSNNAARSLAGGAAGALTALTTDGYLGGRRVLAVGKASLQEAQDLRRILDKLPSDDPQIPRIKAAIRNAINTHAVTSKGDINPVTYWQRFRAGRSVANSITGGLGKALLYAVPTAVGSAMGEHLIPADPKAYGESLLGTQLKHLLADKAGPSEIGLSQP